MMPTPENMKDRTASRESSIIYGFEHPVSGKIIKDAITNHSLEKHLHRIDVKKGDVVFVPAGTVHGIGGGILLAEIQENYNVTYRVYDYDRRDKYGNLRELHIDKAVDVMDMNASIGFNQKPRIVHFYPGCMREQICRCKYFDVERICTTEICTFSVLSTSFQVHICINGQCRVESDFNCLGLCKGDSIYLPAGLGTCKIYGTAEFLKIRC